MGVGGRISAKSESEVVSHLRILSAEFVQILQLTIELSGDFNYGV